MEIRDAVPDLSPIRGTSEALIAHVEEKIGTARVFSNYDDVCHYKSITRAQIEGFLQRAAQQPTFLRRWPMIDRQLGKMNYSETQIMKIEKNCVNYIRMRNNGDQSLRRFSLEARKLLEGHKALTPLPDTILEIAALIVTAQPTPMVPGAKVRALRQSLNGA